MARIVYIPDCATKGDTMAEIFGGEWIEDENTHIICYKFADGTMKTFKKEWWFSTFEKVEDEK